MNIAYVKVSTTDKEENKARQINALEKYDINSWYNETVSMSDCNKPKLKELLKFAKANDSIYVYSLDRLARTINDLYYIICEIQAKGFNLVSIKESIDTNTPDGQARLTMVRDLYLFERENFLERQREGIAIAKKKGLYKGRKKIEYPDNWIEIYTKYESRELKGIIAMEKLGLKKNTFYKLVSEYKEEINKIT